jgi:hypothetical protein
MALKTTTRNNHKNNNDFNCGDYLGDYLAIKVNKHSNAASCFAPPNHFKKLAT